MHAQLKAPKNCTVALPGGFLWKLELSEPVSRKLMLHRIGPQPDQCKLVDKYPSFLAILGGIN